MRWARVAFAASLLGTSGSAQERPDIVLQVGHHDSVVSMDLSPDARHLATAGADGAAIIWDVSTGLQVRRLEGHVEPLTAVSFSADGRRLLTASGAAFEDAGDFTARIWDASTGRELRRFSGHTRRVTCAAFSPDETNVITASDDGTVRIWSAGSGAELRRLVPHHDQAVTSASFSPDGRFFVTSGDDKTAALWDAKTLGEIRRFVGHTDDVRSAAFGGGGRRVLTVSEGGGAATEMMRQLRGNAYVGTREKNSEPDASVRLWDVDTGKEIAKFDVSYPLSPVAVFYDAGRLILTLGKERGGAYSSRIWHAETGELLQRQELDVSGLTHALSSADGTLVIMGDPAAATISDNRGRLLRRLHLAAIGAGGAIFGPDGRTALMAGGLGRIEEWDLATGQTSRVLSRRAGAQPWAMHAVRLSQDRESLVALADFGQAIVWNLKSGRETASIEIGRSLPPPSVNFNSAGTAHLSPDGRQLLIAHGVPAAGLWTGLDSERPTILHELDGHPDEWRTTPMADFVETTCADFSGDGRLIATASRDGRARVWDARSGRLVQTIGEPHFNGLTSVAFSPDGNRLLTAAIDGAVLLWDLQSGTQVRAYSGHDGVVHAASFAGDGRLVVTAGFDRTARVWDAASGRELHRFVGHEAAVHSAELSPDGQRLLTTSDDGTTRVWNAATGAEIVRRVSRVTPGRTEFLAMTPDGYYTFSRGAGDAVAFRVGDRAYPFGQFDLQYNRPDIVAERLGADAQLVAAYRQAHGARLRRAGFTSAGTAALGAVPELNVDTASLPVTTAERELPVHVIATGRVPLAGLLVTINDVPLFGSRGRDLRPLKTRRYDAAVTLPLSAGRNRVQISVRTADGAESLRETFEVHSTAPALRRPRLYVVAVGVSRYRDSAMSLRYAAQDARDFAFTLQARYAPGQSLIQLDVDEEATRERIMNARQLLLGSSVDDEVVVFFAGHGVLDRNMNYFFATHDIDFSSPAARGLSYEDLESLLDGIPARRKLLLIDTCHAGELDTGAFALANGTAVAAPPAAGVSQRTFARGLKAVPSGLGPRQSVELLRELFTDVGHGSGAQVIGAAAGVEFAFEQGELRSGVFTYALREALGDPALGGTPKADINSDNVVSVSELRDYVIDRVRQLTGGRQTPAVRRESIDFDFAIPPIR